MRRLILLVALISMSIPPTLQAAEQLCFAGVPGIRDCISGQFLTYWRQNGGLPVFGYPLTPAVQERTPEGAFLTQYFERQRFELHPEHAAPYNILLGRLGAEIYGRTYGDWQASAPGQRTANCLFFEQTQHSICGPFSTYWQSHGLLDPALDSHGRSLALLGLPLTEPRMERNPDGDLVLTQWFERARLEDHGPRGVLLGRLGAEVRTAQPGPSIPPAHAAMLQRLFERANQERANRGLPLFVRNAQLDQAAQVQSDDLARTDTFSHTGSDGSTAGDRIARTGYPARAWAENLAAGYTEADAVIEGWLQSEGHRRNLLNPDLREAGVGLAHQPSSTYTWYWTMVYGSR